MRRNLAAEQDGSEASSKRVKCDTIDPQGTADHPIPTNTEFLPIPPKEEQLAVRGDGEQDDVEPTVKFRRKCVALFMCYNGFGYYGMQFNAGFKTIEGELLTALAKIGAIVEENKFQLAKMNFQRASKTDKGVSAVRQIVSLKMDTARDYLAPLNAALPPEIRVFRILRATKAFNCKFFCSSRFYRYLCPTFAFSPSYEQTYEGYRIDGKTIQELGDVLSLFKGTHNFHNYTSNVKANDPSCKRYIIEISTGETFVDSKTNLEFISIHLHGQSFILHQIRKIIGMTIAVMKKYAEREIIERSFSLDKIETPKAPSLGLMLARQEFKGYNRKYGEDGMHQPILWDSVEDKVTEFRNNFIYPHIIQQEADEKSMFHWLGFLKKHHFAPEKTNEVTTTESALENPTESNLEDATEIVLENSNETNVTVGERDTQENVEQAAEPNSASVIVDTEANAGNLLFLSEGGSDTMLNEGNPFECVTTVATESNKTVDKMTPDVGHSKEH